MLRLSEADLEEEEKVDITFKKKRDPAQIHGSLLAQSLLEFPGDISVVIRDRYDQPFKTFGNKSTNHAFSLASSHNPPNA